jgi:maleate isomerase
VTDSLGYRCKFGVIAPSTNTSVQPEYEALRPHGVTNHFSRAIIPDTRVTDDASFLAMLENIRGALDAALDAVMTCSPDAVILGMSAETFWDGAEGSARLKEKMERQCGKPVTLGSDAVLAAIKAYGGVKRLGIVTPYMPVADKNVHRYFTDNDLEVVNLLGLKCASPVQIAHVGEAQLRDAIKAVDGADVDAIVQVGTNLAMARIAPWAEFWLGKPVIAINTATYWHALRSNGLTDPVRGYGRLLEEW